MTITNVPELSSMLSKLGLYGNAAQPGSTGSVYSGAASLLPTSSSQGGLLTTVVQALSQIGVSGAQSVLAAGSSSASSATSSGTSSGASQQNASQALRSFMQSLFAALQAQAAAGGTQHGANAASSGSGTGGHRHGHGHGHAGGGGLQSLIQQLSASTSAASTATSASSSSSGTAAATTAAANATVASLQQSFGSLVTALGGSGGEASLGNFLNALASDLAAGAHTGNLVSTQA